MLTYLWKVRRIGVDMPAIVDYGGEYTKHPDDMLRTISAVLTAAKVEFGVTEGQ